MTDISVVLASGLAMGFAVGYAVRAAISHRHRQAAMRRRYLTIARSRPFFLASCCERSVGGGAGNPLDLSPSHHRDRGGRIEGKAQMPEQLGAVVGFPHRNHIGMGNSSELQYCGPVARNKGASSVLSLSSQSADRLLIEGSVTHTSRANIILKLI